MKNKLIWVVVLAVIVGLAALVVRVGVVAKGGAIVPSSLTSVQHASAAGSPAPGSPADPMHGKDAVELLLGANATETGLDAIVTNIPAETAAAGGSPILSPEQAFARAGLAKPDQHDSVKLVRFTDANIVGTVPGTKVVPKNVLAWMTVRDDVIHPKWPYVAAYNAPGAHDPRPQSVPAMRMTFVTAQTGEYIEERVDSASPVKW